MERRQQAADANWAEIERREMAEGFAVRTPACIYDTNNDGDCHLCFNKGGCKKNGGPFSQKP